MLQGMGVDDSLSNLTSAISNEASITSSSNATEMGGTTLHQLTYNPSQPPPPKKRRNLPGNPDPEADVIALSPHALMATNRFVCEICSKGFQRDQNLQLHRRGHNLPWKLKQRNKEEAVRKKVYICPEPSCVHHDPSRALGDLTGIKKHFFRKHGEKKYKCEKCSKRYAVQSDWKAHSKICGTREYRCDCGTLFSRRDSFITHRAFCDALAEETSRSMPPQTAPNNLIHGFHLPLKQETLNFSLPPWLSPDSSSVPGPFQEAGQAFLPAPSLMSATALLQKAAAMGVTMSGNNGKTMAYSQPSDHHHHHHRGDDDPTVGGGGPRPPHQQHHVGAPGFCATASTAGGLPSRDEYVHGLASYGTGKLDNLTGGCMDGGGGSNSMQENMAMAAAAAAAASTSGYQGFDDSFNGIFNAKRNLQSFQQDAHFMAGLRKEGGASASASGGGGDGMTRDFLGLRAFPHRDFSNMAGLDQMGSSSTPFDHQNQAPWQS